MAGIYSTAFLKSHGGAGGSYTVPDGFVAVIRSITAVNTMFLTIPEPFSVYLGDSSCTIVEWTLSNLLPTSPGQSVNWQGRVVVEAHDTINVTNGPDVDVTVSGYLLSAP